MVVYVLMLYNSDFQFFSSHDTRNFRGRPKGISYLVQDDTFTPDSYYYYCLTIRGEKRSVLLTK